MLKRLGLLCVIAGLHCQCSEPVKPAKVSETPAAPATTTAATSRPAEKRAANRLENEKSPYLRQHAHNPVDWYPWGPEAFEKAKKENKPIFLSVGYSTCHWCHVMERESFSNDSVAKILNDNFIAIKVDREERPDVDRIYMSFVQATTGSGGWPMTVMLTPDRKPFFGGTYFPPDEKDGRPGLKTILARVTEVWTQTPEKVIESANGLAKGLGEITKVRPNPLVAVDTEIVSDGAKAILETYDPDNGGFDTSPKFPQPPLLDFLLRHAQQTNNAAERDAVLKTLRAMARGGIHDHLGGGFHRYATDARWFLPHFEKMLYDQAQLATVYTEAHQITGDPFYASVARDILDYLLRDMTGDRGQFFSAEDADSARDPAHPEEKAEGAFYVWRADEVAKLLEAKTAALFAYQFGIQPNGNVDRDPRNEFPSQNVLSIVHTTAETAKQFRMDEPAVTRMLEEAQAKLLAVRSRRPRPIRDDKALVAWNSLAISAFARAGAVLNEPKYTAAAVRAAEFIRQDLLDAKTFTLKRGWLDGAMNVDGFLDDYANFIAASLDLYECTLDVKWLKLAVNVQRRQDEVLRDADRGGYFSTAGGDPHLLYRMTDDSESVEPNGNSVSAMNLARLSQMLDNAEYKKRGQETAHLFAGKLKDRAGTMPAMLSAIQFQLAKPVQIVLAGDPAASDMKAMLGEAHRTFLPARIILAADGGPGQAFLSEQVEFIKTVKPVGGKATAFVCENYTCKAPTNDVAQMRKLLTDEKPANTPLLPQK